MIAKKPEISLSDVEKVAKLANLPLSAEQKKHLAATFSTTIAYVSKVQQLNTAGVIETSQVTGLVNVLREDKVEEDRMFSQDQALANAKRSHKGFFAVKAIFDLEE